MNEWFSVHRCGVRATVRIFDDIGYGIGPTADDLARELGNAKEVHLFIDSAGGCLRASLSVYRALFGRVAACTIRRAFSGAALIAMAADRIRIEEGGSIMVHSPQSAVVGGPVEMRTLADELERLGIPMMEAFVRRTRKPVATVKRWLSADTYFSPAEALAAGLADEIVPLSSSVSSVVRPIIAPSPASSGSGERTPHDEESFLFDLLRAIGTIRTADKARFGRELSQWFNHFVREK